MSALHLLVVLSAADDALPDSDRLGDPIKFYFHTLFGASMADFASQESS